MTYKRDACRCDPCSIAYTRWEKAAKYARLTGRGNMTAPGPARAHVEQLLAGGLTVGQIEGRSGIHRTAIKVLIGVFPGRAPATKITKTTERKLLAVSGQALGPEETGLINPAGTARRIQALVARGYTLTLIAAELGMLRSNFRPIAYGRRPVRQSTRRAVIALYDRLWDQPPPARNAREQSSITSSHRLARRNGWVPPLAWDDDTIDDPSARPADPAPAPTYPIDQVLVQRALGGQPVRASHAERLEVIRKWEAAGRPLNALDALQGWNSRRDLRSAA